VIGVLTKRAVNGHHHQREHSAASRKSPEHPAWRGPSAGHGGIRAAIGFDAGRDAGVAGQRPAPPSAPEPKRKKEISV